MTSDGKLATNVGYLARKQGYPAGVEDFWVRWNAGKVTVSRLKALILLVLCGDI
jgi:hypothetical protein